MKHAVRLAAAARDAMDTDLPSEGLPGSLQPHSSEPQLLSLQQLHTAPGPNSQPLGHLDRLSQHEAAQLQPGLFDKQPQIPSEEHQTDHAAQGLNPQHAQHAVLTQRRPHDMAQQAAAAAMKPVPTSVQFNSQVVSDSRATSDALWQGRQFADRLPAAAREMLPSQFVSDSRATSDALWQGRPPLGGHASQPRALLPSQLVPDSRASSDHRWSNPVPRAFPTQNSHAIHLHAAQMQHLCAHQPVLQLQETAPTETGRVTEEIVQELVWEAADLDAAIPSSPLSASGMREDIEVVISDSQSSPAAAVAQPGQQASAPLQAGQQSQHTGAQQAGRPSSQHARLDMPPDPSMPPANCVNQSQSLLDATAAFPSPSQAYSTPRAVSTCVPGNPPTNTLTAALSAAPAAAGAAAAAAAASFEAPATQEPNFRMHAAAGAPGNEALTPVMVPPAHAHIQAQQVGTSWPSLVKDTPQSAITTPRSRVKDTPLPQGSAALTTRGPVSHIWQPLAGHLTPLILATSAPCLGVGTALGDVDPASQPTLPSPELTLRLSMSDHSTDKTAAMQQPGAAAGQHPLLGLTPTQLGHLAITSTLLQNQSFPGCAQASQGAHMSPVSRSNNGSTSVSANVSASLQDRQQADQTSMLEAAMALGPGLTQAPDSSTVAPAPIHLQHPDATQHLQSPAGHLSQAVALPPGSSAVSALPQSAEVQISGQSAEKPSSQARPGMSHVAGQQPSQARPDHLELSLNISSASPAEQARRASCPATGVASADAADQAPATHTSLPVLQGSPFPSGGPVQAASAQPASSLQPGSTDPGSAGEGGAEGTPRRDAEESPGNPSGRGASQAEGGEQGSPEPPGSSPEGSGGWQEGLILHRFKQPAPTQVKTLVCILQCLSKGSTSDVCRASSFSS